MPGAMQAKAQDPMDITRVKGMSHMLSMYKATPMKCPALLATNINLYFALHAETMETQDIESESTAAIWLDSRSIQP